MNSAVLNTLCPMHVVLDADGTILQAGPTLQKLCPGTTLNGHRFLDLFEVRRPRAVVSMAELMKAAGRKLHLRLRLGRGVELKGLCVSDGAGGAVLNLSFGIGVMEAVRDYDLTSTDFAATDLAIEMLYLVEAKSAAFEASRTLNQRLQGAKIAAEERAFTDTLTGLKNRRAMDHVLERLLRTGSEFALMHLDLDFFKEVNDTRGHAAGDHVLQEAARCMIDETRGDDLVARVGGDEFVLIVMGPADRSRLADIARRLTARIETPILFEGQPCRISTSIGIVTRDAARRPTVTAEKLLEEADIALYAAKRAGRAQHRFFSPDMAMDRLPVAAQGAAGRAPGAGNARDGGDRAAS